MYISVYIYIYISGEESGHLEGEKPFGSNRALPERPRPGDRKKTKLLRTTCFTSVFLWST